ncbi:MAG: ferric reductase-like transmembrane domain-containing protein [Gammaproteobacteria bacterium]
MTHSYKAVGWNRQKRVYDLTLLAGLVVFFISWIGFNVVLRPQITVESIIIRGFAVAAFFLLHVILSIGPLCRLNSRFLPLLYNRRHLGVTMFLLAAVHGVFSLIQFHALGDLNPLVSMLAGNHDYQSVANFPFQPFGFVALIILFLMASTSHDFWLANLTAPVWKALHMSVYVAYVLIVTHVALGVLQHETDASLSAVLAVGVIWIFGLHLYAGFKEVGLDSSLKLNIDGINWVNGGPAATITDNRARLVHLAGERVAVFRYGNKISAVSAVCQHQNGPLGEGCIIDGLITCPWHGYQYDPQTGASPAPFNEQVPTFNVKIDNGNVLIDPTPNPPGALTPAAEIKTSGETISV